MRFKATVKLDLPSQDLMTQPGSIARFLGVKPKPTGHQRVVGSALEVLDRLTQAYRAMGVTNIIGLTVDQKPIYLDDQMVSDDLPEMIKALDAHRQILADCFKMIHLVLEHRAEGLHYVIDTKIRGQVPCGQEEVMLVIAGKIEELFPRPGESPQELRQRIQQLAATPGKLAQAQEKFQNGVRFVAQQLQAYTGASQDLSFSWELGVMRPTRRSFTSLGAVPFVEQRVRFRGACPALGRQTVAYSHDPYSYYYEDPFDALIDAFLIDAVLQDMAAGIPEYALFFQPTGESLGTVADFGEFAEQLSPVSFWTSDKAVEAFAEAKVESDPDIAAYCEAYDSEADDKKEAFDSGDAGYFDAGPFESESGSCSEGESSSSCSSSSCSGSSCSSCSSSCSSD